MEATGHFSVYKTLHYGTICSRCNKPYYTVGDTFDSNKVCSCTVTVNKDTPQDNFGWICPVCRRSLSPDVKECKHVNL